MYALNADNGNKIWSFATHGPVASSPNVANGLVYVGSADGTLYALHANDGSKAWSFATRGAIASAPALFSAGLRVVVRRQRLRAGREHRWSHQDVPHQEAIQTSPALASYGGVDWLIVESTDHTVYAFDANSGKVIRKWSYLTAGEVYATVAISAVERAVFIGTHNWNIEAHYLDTGVERWLYSCPKGLAIYSSPAVANGEVYFACRNGASTR